MPRRGFQNYCRLQQESISGKTPEINIYGMRRMAGTVMMLISPCQYVMKREKQNDIICIMPLC